jgi:hypothetical protein
MKRKSIRLRHSKFVGLSEDKDPKSVAKENRDEGLISLLASFMVVVPSTDVSAATGNRFLGRYQSGRDDDSPCADKEKYERSK